MRRNGPRPLAIAVEQLAGELAPATTLARVQRLWAEAVGPALAAEAEPVSEREGLLTVACRSSVWAQELELMATDLVERVNRATGSEAGRGPLRGLRFVVGRPRPPS